MPEPVRRVAIFGHAAGRRADGLSTYSSELVRSLRAAGIEVCFFAHHEDGEVVPVEAASAHLLHAWRFKTVTVSRPGALRGIVAALRAFAPDVVHISWSFSLQDGAIARAAARMGAMCVATFHLPHGPAGTARGRILQGLYSYQRLQMRHVQRCIVLSDEQRRLLVKTGYPRDRIVVIANGVDTARFAPGRSAWREGLGAAAVALYLGRLDPEKRVPELVESFLDLALPSDHMLCIAGDGVQRKRLQRLAAGRDNVRMLGLVEGGQRLDLLRGSDVFVLPSTAEGLALSLLEAMACGRTIVATDAGEDGRALGGAGLVIPVHPLRPALDEALRRGLTDAPLRGRLGAAARKRAVATFDIRRTTERVLAVYAETMAERTCGVSSGEPAALP